MLLASRRILTIRASTILFRIPKRLSGRAFALTANSQDTLSLHLPDASSSERVTITQVDRPSLVADDYVSTARQQKYNDLLDSLNKEDANPDWTWTYYVDLLDFTRDEPLPLDIHQRVLRKCTHEVRKMRKAFVRRIRERQGRVTDNPHRHEGRFLTVINNIRDAGYTPTLDDYEFILSHFAAVGHYIGSAQVLQEVIKTGLEARTKTFGLCLQSIAYRLSVPCWVSQRAKLREQCSQLCLHIASLIRKRKQRVPSTCLDLILRIMKDTDNADVFRSLLKIAYWIDLDYLDRHAIVADGGFGDPEPLSTAALTTLIDFLGRQKEVSKMVAAFEVLSTPLHVSPSEAHLRNFDDEDDDYDAPANLSQPQPLPFARPNVTTYNTLIRHCTHLHKTALAKHYVLQALELDYRSSARLQSEVQLLPLANIRPPELRVDVDTFRPMLGLGNRKQDRWLVKWLLPHFRLALRRKKQDLQYFSSILDRPDGSIPQPEYPRYPGGLLSEYGVTEGILPDSSQMQNVSNETARNEDAEPSVTFFTPSTTSIPIHPTPASSNQELALNSLDNSLKPARSAAEPPPRPFDLAVHVQVLQRDVQAMMKLNSRIGSSLERLNIRRKERLGRRIWRGKNVYLRDTGQRVQISREDWMEMVNFGGARPRDSSTRDSTETQTVQDNPAETG